MRTPRVVLSFALIAGALSLRAADDLAWPGVTRENKPWTRWWWPGSGVDKASLTWQLEKIAAAGIGGVEITPIYGANGHENRSIDFLSPQWVEMLEHAGREGQRLGVGIDMATGTGWPFGGPWIDEPNALQRAVLRDGRLAGEPTTMLVKRAAPGGEGLVVDPFSPAALRRYLAPFDRAFANFPRGLVRSQFHDSFEYYNGSWTPDFPRVFRAMHGYDVQDFAAALLARPADPGTLDADTLTRIKSDYRDTLARLHLDYLRTWVQWSHDRGFLVRNQSHGAPGNLLDLYANADIAETEIFGSTPFPIPGLRRHDHEVRHDQDLPESLVIRMASSAGHVVGHNLSSSESCTWLRDHWKVALAYAKPELDRILTDGINHIFYHGTVFSPQDAPWPGWLFYASTQFNPNNTWWDDFGALNRYIARVQSILQRGTPDNDILLYWPVGDIWDNADGLMLQLTVHNVKWLTEQPVGRLARAMMERGYGFDYVSDAQLQQTRTESGQLATPGARYKVLVVPATRRMPAATLQRIAQLARDGASVIFEKLPEDVPGYGRLEPRRAEFKDALARWSALTSTRSTESPKRVGVNALHLTSDVMGALTGMGIPREPIADSGVSVIRRATAAGHDYFIANLTAKKFQGWTALGVPAQAAAILDPLTGASGVAALRQARGGRAEIYLQVAPGESLVIRTIRAAVRGTPARWTWHEPSGAPSPVTGSWQIDFVKGGPELPPALQTTALKSWTELGGDEARRFGGTARYRVEFDFSEIVARVSGPVSSGPTGQETRATAADEWLLDLGDVRESARIRLNGRDVTTAWSIPFQARVGAFLRPGRNVLELDVTNLAANRIRDMDQKGVKWKIMREINFVNINYQPFNAAGWSLTPSGLLGPVTLTPLRAVKL